MKPDMQMPPTLSQYFPLVGGLNVESAQLSRKPGEVMGGSNYESVTENGYERLAGCERFDGHPRPSDSVFSVISAANVFTGVVVGDAINGQTSSATAVVIALRGSSELVITKLVGILQVGENIRVGVAVVGSYAGEADDFNSTDDNTYSALAEAVYRADISAVPGSGNLRGIACLGGVLYAFRDNAGATSLAIYKSTASGWAAVALYTELAFTTGNGAIPAEGATITKGAVSATLKRVVLQSGSWAGGTAAGRFIVDAVTAGPFTAGAFTAGVSADASGGETQIALLPGGRLDSVVYNFTGSTATERIYGADGVNRGFEFDGAVLVPIITGMTVDKPRHVACHRNHLFFAFGGSVQHSGISTPYTWTAVLGASELAVGQDVTGFEVAPGDATTSAMLIFSETRSLVLYGSSVADWKLTVFTDKVGAKRWSVQNIGSPVVMDSQGITSVTQAQQFGNFIRPPLSNRIRRYLLGRTVTASVVNRAKSRMRIFFADGEALSITPIPTRYGDMLAFMPINYGKTVSCTCEAVVNGVARTFFGSSDGFVYEADRGRGFDGETVVAWMKLAFNLTKSPGLKKRYRWADVEVKSETAMRLQGQGEYSLGAIDVGLTEVYAKNLEGPGGEYDISNWDACFYDGPAQASVKFRLDGTGTSLSLTFYTEAADELPHELQSVNLFYSPRRLDRG